MMKKMLYLLAVAAIFAGCQRTPEDKKEKIDVVGTWELISVATKASVGSVSVDVYVDFVAGGQFTLFQKIGEGRYTKFSGTYNLDTEAAQLTGKYEGGSSWGPYTAAREGDSLILTTAGGKEVDTYRKVDSVPASVTENTY